MPLGFYSSYAQSAITKSDKTQLRAFYDALSHNMPTAETLKILIPN